MKDKNITTEKIKISNDGAGMKEALDLTEHIAEIMQLDKKNKNRARLLAEEMLSMVRAIAGEFNAEYWLERENNSCVYHLFAKLDVDYEKRRNFLSASTKGENIAQRGIMEKIREIIEAGLYGLSEGVEYSSGMMSYGSLEMDGMYLYSWSMNQYKDDLKNESEDSEQWDELEKSIIANIADDVKVGVKRDSVELTVYKKF